MPVTTRLCFSASLRAVVSPSGLGGCRDGRRAGAKGTGASSEVRPAARSCASQEVTHTHSGTSVSHRGVFAPRHNSGTKSQNSVNPHDQDAWVCVNTHSNDTDGSNPSKSKSEEL